MTLPFANLDGPSPPLAVGFLQPQQGATIPRLTTVAILLNSLSAHTVTLQIDSAMVNLTPALSYYWKPRKRGVRLMTARATGIAGNEAAASITVTVA